MTLQEGGGIANRPGAKRLSARKLNQFERRVLQGSRAAPGQAVKSNAFGTVIQAVGDPVPAMVGASGSAVRTVKLVSVHDDHLVCETFAGERLNVLKPDLFRKSRWDGKTRDKGTLVTFLSPDAVRATPGPNADITAGYQEIWRITPSYLVDDYLRIILLESDAIDDVVKGLGIEWADANDEGRAWAVDVFVT